MIIQGTAIKGMTVSSSAAGITSDSYFNLVSLLLPGNGTNGAQNNTFLDSSTNNLTVTRNGNTTQGTFSPFSFGGGTAQADGYYSGYFDGTGDYLSVASNAAFQFGTGDFTVEAWWYPTTISSTYQTIAGVWATGNYGWILQARSTDILISIGSGFFTVTGSATIVANQWYHVAASRSGTTVRVFLNGVLLNSGTSSASATASTPLQIGRNEDGNQQYVNGYLSGTRLVKGTAVYTANFTVPTTPLTNITNTSLLTCQSSQFIDNSTNAFTITVNGNSQPTVVNPFGMTDWSGYFDGTGDYLTTPSNAAFYLATGDFTVEAFVYKSASGREIIVSQTQNTSGSYDGWLFYVDASNLLTWEGSNASRIQDTTALTLNTWFHVAAVRSSGTTRLYKNGVQVASGTPSITNFAGNLTIGQFTTPISGSEWLGNISNLRIVKGTAVYTSAFTPPTAPLTAITNTSLLTCQSSTFIDNSPNAFAITVNGNAYTGTLNNPFNSSINYTTPPLQAWSNYFSSTGDNLRTGTMTALGSGDFTLEMWVFPLSFANYRLIWDNRTSDPDTNGFAFGLDANAKVYLYTNNLFAITTTTALVANTWTHIALVRNGSGSGNVKIYINGVADATTATNTANMSRTLAYIGNDFDGTGSPFVGYLSNMRATTRALYSTTFTPSTSPLSAVANTVLLTCQSNRFVDNSINQVAITRNGDTSVQPFSPFNPDAAYSTSSIGASMYFDGASKLTTSASIDISGVFTIESWFNSTNAGGWFFTIGNFPVYIDVSAGTITLDKSSVGNQLVTTANEQVKGSNCWKHLAITRDGSGLIRVFVNGVLLGSVSTSYSAGTLNGLGQYASYGGPWLGYACDFRVVVGTALYTSAFTPPTAPLTAVSGTAILLSGINAGIYDAAAKNVLETVGGAAISTTQSKWGGSAMYFDGVDDNAIIPYNPIFSLGTADFTVEGWFYFSNISTTRRGIVALGDGANGGGPYSAWSLTYLGSEASNQIALSRYDGTSYDYATSGFTISANTWYHIAVARYSGVLKIFVNGISYYSNTVTTNFNAVNTNPLRIGLQYYGPAGGYGGPRYWNGYINDLRITRGYARYTANFTPPTAAFPTQ